MRNTWFEVGMILFMVVAYVLWSKFNAQCEEFGGTMVRGAGTWECIVTHR